MESFAQPALPGSADAASAPPLAQQIQSQDWPEIEWDDPAQFEDVQQLLPSRSRSFSGSSPPSPSAPKSPPKLISLKELEERQDSHPRWATHFPALERLFPGGLRRGALAECIAVQPSSGSRLFMNHCIRQTRREGVYTVLIDGSDTFDLEGWKDDELAHLLWLRCNSTRQALKAADILTRDANFFLLLLDLCGCAENELRRIPSHSWYRLQRAVEENDSLLLCITPRPLVSSAASRWRLTRSLSLDVLEQDTAHTLQSLEPTLHAQEYGTQHSQYGRTHRAAARHSA